MAGCHAPHPYSYCSSGKDIANGKGIVGDCESEGSRMANLWSDEQKSYQAINGGKAATQVKAQ